jgi:hypothetical protein
MRALLTPFHTLVNTIPLALQCVTLSTLFLSWFGAHLAMEYGVILKRPVAFSAWLTWLCGPPTTLLLLVLLVDTLSTQDYGKLRLLGVMAVLLLLVGGIGQRACRAAAAHDLFTAGHTATTLTTTPARPQKRRGA